MDFYDRYRESLAGVFEDAAEEAGRFPARLRAVGRSLVDACNPLASAGKSNYITYLLPYWTDELTGRGEPVCRDLAAGSVFAMLHYFIADDLMDEGASAVGSVRDALTAGQLFHAAFQSRYARHAAPGSPVWEAYRRYASEWAEAVSREGESPADPRDPRQLAGKSAPVKLGAAALLYGTRHERRLPEIEEAVELALAVLQLSDDWHDWRQDLAAPNGNAFLTLVRTGLELPDDAPLTEQEVRRAIYREGGVKQLADIAHGYAARLGELDAPAMLSAFAESLSASLARDAKHAESVTRNIVHGGGFSYMLSQISEK